MKEFAPSVEEELSPRALDRELIIGRLQEYGVGIEPEDLEGLDDQDVMGEIVTYVAMYDLDMDDILPEVTPIEHRTRGEEGEPYSDEI